MRHPSQTNQTLQDIGACCHTKNCFFGLLALLVSFNIDQYEPVRLQEVRKWALTVLEEILIDHREECTLDRRAHV